MLLSGCPSLYRFGRFAWTDVLATVYFLTIGLRASLKIGVAFCFHLFVVVYVRGVAAGAETNADLADLPVDAVLG